MELDPAVRAYYDRGREAQRLFGGFPSGPLELERTRELILRHLPDGTLRILDVGGAAGVHASWLGELGHEVRIVEPVPLHVEQATAAGIDAELGDARDLAQGDSSVDVVLLLGPLYHLLEVGDRQRALSVAHRVLRPGGLLFAAGIARYSNLYDNLVFNVEGPGALVQETAGPPRRRSDGRVRRVARWCRPSAVRRSR